jgi:hypothetical protein
MNESLREEPSKAQIKNCAGSGWEYIGDGYFIRCDLIGWFQPGGFKKL